MYMWYGHKSSYSQTEDFIQVQLSKDGMYIQLCVHTCLFTTEVLYHSQVSIEYWCGSWIVWCSVTMLQTLLDQAKGANLAVTSMDMILTVELFHVLQIGQKSTWHLTFTLTCKKWRSLLQVTSPALGWFACSCRMGKHDHDGRRFCLAFVYKGFSASHTNCIRVSSRSWSILSRYDPANKRVWHCISLLKLFRGCS